MEEDFKKEARKQYLHYFRFWFIGIGILAAACIAAALSARTRDMPRANNEAPKERVTTRTSSPTRRKRTCGNT